MLPENICAFQILVFFLQTKLNLIWNFCLLKFHHFFPNQTGFGLEFVTLQKLTQLFSKPNWIWFGNICQYFEDSFPNQTGFGLETDTE